MKKLPLILLIIAVILFIAGIAHGAEPQYRAYYPALNNRYVCQQVKWGSSGTICYATVNGKLKSLGVGELEPWTGLYDSLGNKVYQNDIIVNDGLEYTVVWDTSFSYGWNLLLNNVYYPFYNDYARTLVAMGTIK